MHKQVEIKIKNKNVKVDHKIASLIYNLNKLNFETLYSCQGDTENCGYIKFSDKVNLEKAKDAFNVLMPKHIAIIDNDQCIRFFNGPKSWMNYYRFLKRVKKLNLKYVLCSKSI